MKIKENDTVQVHYTGRLVSGEEFDSSLGREPLEFIVGAGGVIAGFDHAVLGMEVNEKKTFTIPVQYAYGPVREDLIQHIDRSFLPDDIQLEVGRELMASDQEGRQLRVTIKRVEEDFITIDANHPLAGEDLIFDIMIVKII